MSVLLLLVVLVLLVLNYLSVDQYGLKKFRKILSIFDFCNFGCAKVFWGPFGVFPARK